MRIPPTRTPVLLGTQLLFNVGFYAVVPFLALVLTRDFGLTALAVGLVLGIRTFAQQGLFLVGGVLADRFGARRVILLGCAMRVAGFATLAAALLAPTPALPLFVVGTVLTGLGGALFSPGLNVLIADAEARRPDAGGRSRASLFAWLSVTGELGAVIGPLVGAALLGSGFVVVALSGAALFTAIGLFLRVALPPGPGRRTARTRGGAWRSLRDRRFVGFSAATALMFASVSVLTLALQLPLSRWAGRVGAAVALRTGYALSATGFGVLAVGATAATGDAAVVSAVFVSAGLIAAGHMLANPTALALVPRFAAALPTGSFFGLLATCGGVAVLGGNLVSGALSTWPAVPAAAAAFLALPLVVAAVATPRLAARVASPPRSAQAPFEGAVRD